MYPVLLGSPAANTVYTCFDHLNGTSLAGGIAYDGASMVSSSPSPIFSLFGDPRVREALLWNK